MTYEIAKINSCSCSFASFIDPPSSKTNCNSFCNTANFRLSASKSKLVTYTNINKQFIFKSMSFLRQLKSNLPLTEHQIIALFDCNKAVVKYCRLLFEEND